MLKVADLQKTVEPRLGLVARTKARSPAEVWFSVGFLGAFFAQPILDKFRDMIVSLPFTWQERLMSTRQDVAAKKELWVDMLGFTRNADFFMGRPEGDIHGVQRDLDTVEAIIDSAVATFRDVPSTNEDRDPVGAIDWQSNLISVGGPRYNPFVPMFLESSDFPYKFLEVNGSPSTVIITDNDGNTMYEPDLYIDGDSYVYNRDYGMIVKGPTGVEGITGHGRQALILAGCHSAGTQAAFYCINDLEQLRKIFAVAGNRPFQAIVGLDVARGPRDKWVLGTPNLLEVKTLT